MFKVARVLFLASDAPLGGATWFLKVLLVITLVFSVSNYIDLYFRIKCTSMFMVSMSIIFAYFVNIRRFSFPSHIDALFCSYIIFVVGKYFKEYSPLKFLHNRSITLVSVLSTFLLTSVTVLSRSKGIDIHTGNIVDGMIYVFNTICGLVIMYNISCFVEKKKYISSILQYIGRHTLPIVCLHFLAFKLCSLLYVVTMTKSSRLLAKYPTIKEGEIWIVYSVLGIFIPLVLFECYKLMRNSLITPKYWKSKFEAGHK